MLNSAKYMELLTFSSYFILCLQIVYSLIKSLKTALNFFSIPFIFMKIAFFHFLCDSHDFFLKHTKILVQLSSEKVYCSTEYL